MIANPKEAYRCAATVLPRTRLARVLAAGLLCALSAGTSFAAGEAEVCEFKDAGRRRISGENPADLDCIRQRAMAGDAFQQFYLGLIQVGQVPGPVNLPEGVRVLSQVAKLNNRYSANAMVAIGRAYQRPDAAFRNDALAYQWFYLASQHTDFKGLGYPLPDQALSAALGAAQMQALEREARRLLQ
ncbi:MAG: hypothetical protein IPN40_13870 [Uliginosibacterium sp.]|nr:hypothetical protein [Uliginosibacterium sp.]